MTRSFSKDGKLHQIIYEDKKNDLKFTCKLDNVKLNEINDSNINKMRELSSEIKLLDKELNNLLESINNNLLYIKSTIFVFRLILIIYIIILGCT